MESNSFILLNKVDLLTVIFSLLPLDILLLFFSSSYENLLLESFFYYPLFEFKLFGNFLFIKFPGLREDNFVFELTFLI